MPRGKGQELTSNHSEYLLSICSKSRASLVLPTHSQRTRYSDVRRSVHNSFCLTLIGRGLNVKFSTTHMQPRFWRQLQNARLESHPNLTAILYHQSRRSLLYFHEGVLIQSHAELGTEDPISTWSPNLATCIWHYCKV